MAKKMLFLFVLLLSLTGMLKAQVTTAGMSGKVMADEESVIGATVVAVHEPSGTSYGTVTNVDGRFSLQGMRSGGPYKVTVSYIGYQTAIYTGIQLQLGETYSLNVTLHEASELLGEITIRPVSQSSVLKRRELLLIFLLNNSPHCPALTAVSATLPASLHMRQETVLEAVTDAPIRSR